jgi:flavin reductase (DIM6/NTAB) family NADH-FMN oxidoreductase RutF
VTATTGVATDLFRGLLRRHAAGVVVITVPGERPAGFTATSFTSVSLHPPLVSFCIDHGASSRPAVDAATHAAVHVLDRGQTELARTFATSGIDRFAEVAWRPGPHGVPVLAGAHAVLVCRIAERVAAGDHTIVLAEPVDGILGADGTEPLLYHMGRYLRAA